MTSDKDMIYFEDLAPGWERELGPKSVEHDEVVVFAEEFDPQPMHLDEEAGKASILGGLGASGWHTCAMMMRMICDAYLLRVASEGAPGLDYVKWRKPVLVGDVLTGTARILESRRLKSRPGIGLVRFQVQLRNQRGELVLESQNPGMVRLRDPEAAQA